MNYVNEYRKKLVSADEAVKVVNSGDWIDYGSMCGQVVMLDEALARRKEELKDVKIWTLLTLRRPRVMDVDPEEESFVWHSWHLSAMDRKIASERAVYYSPIRYSELPRYVREHIEPLAVAMLQVAPMDKHGYFNFGPQNSHTRAVCERARIVIVEVNNQLPRCLGGYEESIHISEVDYIVEGNNPPLPQLPDAASSEVDKKAAELIIEEMKDECCVQLGIGGMPNAVGKMIAESDLKDLGCHTEMLVDAYVHMYEAGRLTGRKKNIDPGKMVYDFAVGSQRLYDFIDNNPLCASYPVNYTNRPSIAALNDNLITINNAIEVDLYGQVCAESVGTRIISGTGGQLDFVLAAYESRGGKSFVCLPSCSEREGKLKSKIVPTLKPGAIVTDPRSVAHYIVTEYGKFAMKGMSVWQRAEGLINLAHPQLRDELIQAAQAQGIWRRSNKIS
ncbi:acetyl-CoA hydrolase/transferase C-terminal domain-containing protein [Cutibacterium avidum]|uniref:Probable butyrate:acetyl-CoA coenzyme A-transferase n=1 Tax=Syntrophomonas wolfei subsp. wolfei (strain DSM 2245B / Goettingen) TaxID=335541 RepID=Q0AZT0_SYNWW|nr:acetyl-CoA hydrolase/transferase C-terminal domain-containing protein [Syntrophomonas wolfei]ABI67774.1 4-hydroxybutyrate coenzyme A transferase [Syntrophomonas wolfei subsp. wolfei str. Goettingen G311]